MTYKIVIPGRLPGLNEIVDANRRNKFGGNKLKQDSEFIIKLVARNLPKLSPPCDFVFDWYEESKRRDKDNISAGKKFIFDALVKIGKLPNDGWSEVGSFADRFHIDKKDPRIIVTIFDRKGEEDGMD